MRSLFLRLCLAVFVPLALVPMVAGAAPMMPPAVVHAVFGQTIYQTFSSTTVRINAGAVNCASGAAARWTGWVEVSAFRSVIFDIDFTDGDSSAASLDVRCEQSISSATAADSGRDLGIIVASATSGTSTVIPIHTLQYKSTVGGNPGSFSTTLYITDIPAPFIECLFTCGAGGAAADTIGVQSRKVTP